jgi:hypothetical protein
MWSLLLVFVALWSSASGRHFCEPKPHRLNGWTRVTTVQHGPSIAMRHAHESSEMTSHALLLTVRLNSWARTLRPPPVIRSLQAVPAVVTCFHLTRCSQIQLALSRPFQHVTTELYTVADPAHPRYGHYKQVHQVPALHWQPPCSHWFT